MRQTVERRAAASRRRRRSRWRSRCWTATPTSTSSAATRPRRSPPRPRSGWTGWCRSASTWPRRAGARRWPRATRPCWPRSPCTPTRRPDWPTWTKRCGRSRRWPAQPRVRGIGETGLDPFRTGEDGSGRAGAQLPGPHRHRQAVRQGAGHPRPGRPRRRAAGPRRRGRAGPGRACTASPATPSSRAECVRRGFTLSFAGTVTFANAAALREAARVTPLEQMLVETDAPFLTPMPYRGRPNGSYLIPLTVRALAEVDRHRPGRPCARPSPPPASASSARGSVEPRCWGRPRSAHLAAELGVTARPRPSGQNFVHDPNTVRRIVRAAAELTAGRRGGRGRARARLADPGPARRRPPTCTRSRSTRSLAGRLPRPSPRAPPDAADRLTVHGPTR